MMIIIIIILTITTTPTIRALNLDETEFVVEVLNIFPMPVVVVVGIA